MKVNSIKKELNDFKSYLLDLEKKIRVYGNKVKERENSYKNYDKKIDEFLRTNDKCTIINVGGEKYEVSMNTLKQRRGTLFYKQILRGELKPESETFYDRDPTYFHYILGFLRRGKLDNIELLNDEQKEDLIYEAQFYEVNYIIETVRATPPDIEFVKVEISEEFIFQEQVIGTNNPKDLKDKRMQKGVVCNTPATITIQLNREVMAEELLIGGYNGNSVAWYPGNGAKAKIKFSLDGVIFQDVGVIPDDFGAKISKIKIAKVKAKFIRFEDNNYIGLGYLDVKEQQIKKK